MLCQSFFPIDQLKNKRPFWEGNIHETVLALIQKLLVEISDILGLKLQVVVPERFLKHDPLTWDAFPFVETLKKVGIVRSFVDVDLLYPDEPRGHIIRIVINGRGGIGYKGSGRNMLDKQKAVQAAVGEGVERWSLSNYHPSSRECIESSFKNLRHKKLDIFSIAGFSDTLRKKDHSEFNLYFDETTPFRWVKAHSLTDDEIIYVPLQLVSFRRCYEMSKKHGGKHPDPEPLLAPMTSNGAAAGKTLEEAVLHGLLEVVERDAFIIHWLNTITPERIDINTIPDERVQALATIAERYNLEAYLIYLRTDVPVHTVMCMLLDKTGIGPAVYIDAKSGFQLSELVCAILSSALASRQGGRKFMDLNMPLFHFKNHTSIKHKERLLYWYQKERIQNVLFWTRGDAKNYTDFPNYAASMKSTAEQIAALLAFFKKQKYAVFYKEILRESIKKKLNGMTAVMVKAPQLQPLHLDESLPAFAGARIREVPRKMGIMPRAHPNTFPHPFE